MELEITHFDSRKSPHGRRARIAWADLCQTLSQTEYTNETAAEYEAMSKDERGEAKDIGGFVGGTFCGNFRRKARLLGRRLLTLDVDNGGSIEEALMYLNLLEYEAFIYTSHSHTAKLNKFRVIMPLNRTVTGAEYEAIAREVMQVIPIEGYDETASANPAQLMYYPSTPKDGEFRCEHVQGDTLDVDKMLEGVTVEEAQPSNTDNAPADKGGLIGAFCERYTIEDAAAEFLSDVYEPGTEPNRYTYIPGHMPNGLLVNKDGTACAFNESDPANGKPVNAFDLVRLHLFGNGANSLYDMLRLAAEQVGQSYYDDTTLSRILRRVERIDYKGVSRAGRIVVCVEHVLKVANEDGKGLCIMGGLPFVYDGTYWVRTGKNDIMRFLEKAAVKTGIPHLTAKYHKYREELYAQFTAAATKGGTPKADAVLINTENGTLEIQDGKAVLREHRRGDYITYKLPYGYDPKATCPIFDAYLKRVQPDEDLRKILAEFIGYVFTKDMKLEKALILLGTGANGKSVFYDIVRALLGGDNISSYGLRELTDEKGYSRADLQHKLLNFCSEISRKMDGETFKRLVSGEPTGARRPFGEPFEIRDYAKLAFNSNELPRDGVEQTYGFYRRFLIAPFRVRIPEEERDAELAQKIIGKELPGVLNWVLDGLGRLRGNGGFTYSVASAKELERYRTDTDSVKAFIEDKGLEQGDKERIALQDIYFDYGEYCKDSGYKPVGNRTLLKRLEDAGFDKRIVDNGVVILAEKYGVNNISEI